MDTRNRSVSSGARLLTMRDLRFRQIRVNVGMPQIHRNFLNSVFFLYRCKEDAEMGKNTGGTGFLTAVPSQDGHGHHYGVSNWHIAVNKGCTVIRLNRIDGGKEIIETDPDAWEFDRKNDLAAVPLSIRDPAHAAFFVGTQAFMSEGHAAQEEIGPGDDVFMIGRFVDLNEHEKNTPTVRFGHISTFPVDVDGKLSYCLDMHSRSGYSGSPVFWYRTPGSDLRWAVTNQANFDLTSKFLFLGVLWGQFWEDIKDPETNELTPKGLSGMSCATPAWKLLELLDRSKFSEQRRLKDHKE